MRTLYRFVVLSILLVLSVGAFGQSSTQLAKCLGKSRDAYAKAFEDNTKWVKDGDTIGQYMTDMAKIEVIQTKGAKLPNIVNVNFYQQPKRDWKLALRDVGLSSAGVVAKEDSKHWVHLSKIKAGKSVQIEAVFVPMESETSNGPELHLKLRVK